MTSLFTRRTIGLLTLLSSLWTAQATAHLDLIAPIPREQGRFDVLQISNTNLKEGPCGQRENGRTSKVNVFAPGETITLVWDEYVNHRSYYRVAFDRNGDDSFPVFAGPGIDPTGHDPRDFCPVDGEVILAYELQDEQGGQYTLEVTLPDVECENCTLQVVQYMYGRNRTRPYYFQCADLALRSTSSSLDAGVVGSTDAGAILDASLDVGVLGPDAGGFSDAGDAALTEDAAAVPQEPVAAASCWQQLPQAPLPDLAPLPLPEEDEQQPSVDSPPSGMSSPLDAGATSTEPGTMNNVDIPARSASGCGCRIFGREQSSNGSQQAGLLAILVLGGGLWSRRQKVVLASGR